MDVILVSENAGLCLPAEDDKRTVCSRSLTDSKTHAVENKRLTHLIKQASFQGAVQYAVYSQPIFTHFQEQLGQIFSVKREVC
jgi:hypothetical protein